MPQTPLVLVTGASGFIASWVAHTALKVGYRVRGTVRSLANEQKIAHLRDLCPGSRHKIELVEADLTSDAGWDEAVRGCHYILHVASPFVLGEPDDPEALIRPAIDGTIRVLSAASRMSKPPKRVVMTSSSMAITRGRDKTNFTEEDFSDLENPNIPVNAYTRSKTLAERAAWDFVRDLPAHRRFEFAVINPTAVQGPMLSTSGCSSAEVMVNIITGKYPGLPDLRFSTVSVYDVARAHLLAMTHPKAAGKRFIVTAKETGLREYAEVINREFRPHGYRPVSLHLPGFIIRALAFFGDKDAKGSVLFLGHEEHLSTKNTREILGLELKEEFDMVKEMTLAAIVAGLVPDKSPGQRLSKGYVRPPFDTSMIPAAEESAEYDN